MRDDETTAPTGARLSEGQATAAAIERALEMVSVDDMSPEVLELVTEHVRWAGRLIFRDAVRWHRDDLRRAALREPHGMVVTSLEQAPEQDAAA